MSIDEPELEYENESKNIAGKRDAQDFKPFYVDDTYAMELSDKPAWEVMHQSELGKEANRRIVDELKMNSTRLKRANRRKGDDTSQQQQQTRPWECEAKIM